MASCNVHKGRQQLLQTEQYLQDVGHWIATVGTCNEIQSFREKFPHIQLPDHEYHGEDGQ